MNKLYFDTSYVFRLYDSAEPGADKVQALAGTVAAVATAWHGRAELAAVLLRKRRESGWSEAEVREVLAQMEDDRATGFVEFLPLSESVLQRVETTLMTVPAGTYLRAADALHLACASAHGFTEVHSNDRHFLAAAPFFGLKGRDLLRS